MTFTDEELDFIIKYEPSEVTSSLARELKAMRVKLPSIEKELERTRLNYESLFDEMVDFRSHRLGTRRHEHE